MTNEKTTRRNGKWAKVSGQRGRWVVAKGWAGQIEGKVQVWPTKDGANVAAENWIND